MPAYDKTNTHKRPVESQSDLTIDKCITYLCCNVNDISDSQARTIELIYLALKADGKL